MDSKTLYVLIGRLAVARRKALELTQEEVAQRMGISRASLANMEVGRQRLLIHQLYELAKALKLSGPEELLPKIARTGSSRELPSIIGAELSEMERDQIAGFLNVDVAR
jgi:transcriptional regulator with XRE-family HTH domain